MENYILDNDFLKQLYESQHREIYARILALSKDEMPIEEIQGKIQSGNINIDGQSSVRRTCQLTMIAQNVNLNDYLWGLHNKFKLFIGLKNNINPIYPDIIWFRQGIFVITSFSVNLTNNSYSINIGGKDKMCLLNGEVGGSLPHMVDFGVQEEYDSNGNTIYTEILIKDIIQEAVHHYGNELIQNIIINDLNDIGVEVLEYRGKTPLYLFKNIETNIVDQMTLSSGQPIIIVQGSGTNLSDIEYDNFFELETGIIENNPTIIQFKGGETRYTVAKIEVGDIPGYRPTDLTYAGELIANVGESLTSVLDKIIGMLGEFEYFYDLDGRFIFQKKNNYLDVRMQGIENYDELRPKISMDVAEAYYSFLNSKIINSFQNTPNLLNLKNDYSIWGTRSTVSGVEIPIHLRYAIDKKPQKYTTIRFDVNKTYKADEYDWRELIYQMAKDYRKCYHNDDFLTKLAAANPEYYNGKTGYEQYYVDMEGFWRELYNPFESDEDYKRNPLEEYKKEDYNSNHWAKIISEQPENLNFWFDFLEGNLKPFSTYTVGDRTKAINDNKIKAIYYREIPNVLFINKELKDKYPKQTGYTYIQLDENMKNLFSISSIGLSTIDSLKQNLYKHSYCIDSTTIQCLPVYHLQPNTRIFIQDERTGINGEYSVDKITIPLNYNGIMSINATKVVENMS